MSLSPCSVGFKQGEMLMNPYILIGIDLVVSTLLILLVLYISLNRDNLFAFREKKSKETMPPGRVPDELDLDSSLHRETEDDPLNVGEMTQNAESLKKKGLSVEEIAGRLKVPKGEIELVLALSELKRMDSSDRYGSPKLKSNRAKAARRKGKTGELPFNGIKERLAVYQEKNKMVG